MSGRSYGLTSSSSSSSSSSRTRTSNQKSNQSESESKSNPGPKSIEKPLINDVETKIQEIATSSEDIILISHMVNCIHSIISQNLKEKINYILDSLEFDSDNSKLIKFSSRDSVDQEITFTGQITGSPTTPMDNKIDVLKEKVIKMLTDDVECPAYQFSVMFTQNFNNNFSIVIPEIPDDTIYKLVSRIVESTSIVSKTDVISEDADEDADEDAYEDDDDDDDDDDAPMGSSASVSSSSAPAPAPAPVSSSYAPAPAHDDDDDKAMYKGGTTKRPLTEDQSEEQPDPKKFKINNFASWFDAHVASARARADASAPGDEPMQVKKVKRSFTEQLKQGNKLQRNHSCPVTSDEKIIQRMYLEQTLFNKNIYNLEINRESQTRISVPLFYPDPDQPDQLYELESQKLGPQKVSASMPEIEIHKIIYKEKETLGPQKVSASMSEIEIHKIIYKEKETLGHIVQVYNLYEHYLHEQSNQTTQTLSMDGSSEPRVGGNTKKRKSNKIKKRKSNKIKKRKSKIKKMTLKKKNKRKTKRKY